MSAPRNRDGLIVALPLGDGEALHWWRVADGAIVDAGQDANVRDAAGLPSVEAGERVMALVPADLAAVSTQNHPGLAPRQAEAAARIAAIAHAIGGDADTHAATAYVEGDEAGAVTVATIARSRLAAGLAALQAQGIDPDIVLPVGLLLPSGDPVSATIGAEPVVRAIGRCWPDEPALTALLLPDTPPMRLPEAEVAALLEAGFAAPALNLRSGAFAKARPRSSMSARQKRILAIMVAAVVLLPLLIALIWLARLNLAASSADERALASARAVVGQASDVGDAERKLDARLSASGRGGAQLGVVTAALERAMQAAPGTSVRTLGWRADGTLSTTLQAPRVEDLNAVLIALQTAGWRVTANPRQESSGQSVADITVRAP